MSLRDEIRSYRWLFTEQGQATLPDILERLAEEIDRLNEELELTQRRCNRNRDTSDDWMD